MQFTSQDAFYEIYEPVSNLFKDRLLGIDPDWTKKLELPEKSPGEYCNDFVREFRGNVAGQSKEQVGKYAEIIYYQLVHRLFTLLDYHQAYYKRFGMDSDNEGLANNYISPLSILVTNVFNISWDLCIAELTDLEDINLKTDFNLRGAYKPLARYEKYVQERHKQQRDVTSSHLTINRATHDEHKQSTEDDLKKVKESKKPIARPFANFIDKLQNGFTEHDLNNLLIHTLIKNKEGETLRFKKYILHSIIKALIEGEYFEAGSQDSDFKGLCRFIGLSETRIKNGYGDSVVEEGALQKARSYLIRFKKEQKKNSSNLIP